GAARPALSHGVPRPRLRRTPRRLHGTGRPLRGRHGRSDGGNVRRGPLALMDRFPARYFDGHSSAVHDVEVRVEGTNVLVIGERVLLTASLGELRFRPRLGRLPVSIELPDGSLLQGDANAVGAVIELPPASGFAQRLESHLGAVVVALAGIAVAGWFGYHDGVPWLAREVAYRLPPPMEKEIADEGLKGLDHTVF